MNGSQGEPGGRPEREHLFLIGFMGAGKSRVGGLVAGALGRPFVDLDHLVEEREGRSVTSVFRDSGEAVFREMEHRALVSLVEADSSVIACGGGVVLRDDNVEWMRAHGQVVFLQVAVDEVLRRIGDPRSRPLLADDPKGAASRLLAERSGAYQRAAHAVVDTSGRSVREVAESVLALPLVARSGDVA